MLNQIISFLNRFLKKFQAISLGSKIAILVLFVLILGLIINYFVIYPIIKTYVLICIYHFVVALESATDIIIHNKPFDSDIIPRTVKEVNCLNYEELFNQKIKPASGEFATGTDLLTNQSICKICLNEILSDHISFNVPDWAKKSVKHQLTSKCYCVEITNDLKKMLEAGINFDEKD